MQIQYNNQNFQALHASPKTLKRLGTTKEALLKNCPLTEEDIIRVMKSNDVNLQR